MAWERRLGLACGFAGLVLVLVTAGFVVAQGGPTARTGLVAAAGLALLSVTVAMDPAGVAWLLLGRPAEAALPAVLATAAVAGVLAAANIIVSPSLQAADVTRTGQHTLTSRSVQAMRQLGSDLMVTGLFSPAQRDAEDRAQALLDLYRRQSRHVKVRFLDPDQRGAVPPGLASQPPGTVVLQYRDRPAVALDASRQTEAGVTEVVLRLERSRSPATCWAMGDGERDLADVNVVSGYSGAARLVQASGYRLREVMLAQPGALASCDVLVLLQLGQPLPDASAQAVQGYLAGGGKLLIALDPWPGAGVLASANVLVQPYGLGFDGGLVVEGDLASAAAGDSTIPLVTDFGGSPVTAGLAGTYVFMPQATPVTAGPTAGVTMQTLAETSARAYDIPLQRTDLARRSSDRRGPFALMRSAERSQGGGRTTRVVVVGTSALAENRTLPPSASGSNGDLLRASLDWLTRQDQLVGLAPKPPPAAPLTLNDAAVRANVALTLVGLPLLLVAVGVGVHASRRRRRV
ncbi:MAG TPA: Gldg family protein [Candidatus Dormibacteraeota bacterium]|nr:Gldg family protein [Candidatus Dormibacteraeota bacterium]